MPLSPIGDISTATLSETTGPSALTWETSTDWDNSVSEAGVVHEAYADLPGADVVTMGYPSFDRGGSSLKAFWPMTESGAPFADVTGNGHDLSIANGSPSTNVTPSPFGRGAVYGDSTDRLANGSDWSFDTVDYTTLGWAWFDDSNADTGATLWCLRGTSGDSSEMMFFINQDGDPSDALSSYHGSDTANSSYQMPNQTWKSTAFGHDGNAFYALDDGSLDSVSQNKGPDTNQDFSVFRRVGGEGFAGRISHLRVYTRVLSQTEIANFFSAGTGGELTTGTKSFSASQTPNLSNLSYSLNDGSIDVDVIGSPGTASEEVVTQTLDGSTSFTLSWSNSHTDFRVRPNFSTPSVVDSPATISRLELQP